MPDMLFLYNFPCTTTKALDLRTIFRASTTSLGNVLLTMYAIYGCIHVTSTIMTSAGSIVSSVVSLSAPEPVVVLYFCLLEFEVLLSFIDLSMISSQKTPIGIGRHWDPMFAKLSASSLLDLLTCDTLHPSNVHSR
jgi:hypothetical protein